MIPLTACAGPGITRDQLTEIDLRYLRESAFICGFKRVVLGSRLRGNDGLIPQKTGVTIFD
ncbi:MAG: hypothetical protein JNM43_24010 [Planctomycetaceae bacterium]|nr:hypothetical protein [Planctomycetaceae bacterium]